MSNLGHKKGHEAEWRDASSLFGIGASRNRPPPPADQPSGIGNLRTPEEGAPTNRHPLPGLPPAKANPHTATTGAMTRRSVRPQPADGGAAGAAGMVGRGVGREGVEVSRAAGSVEGGEGARGAAETVAGGMGDVRAVETIGVWAGIARAAETVGGWVGVPGIAGIIGEGVEGAGRGVQGSMRMVEGEMGVAGAAGAVGGGVGLSRAAKTAGGKVEGKRVTGRTRRKVRRNGAAAKTRKAALESWAKMQKATRGMVVRRSKHRKNVSFGERTVNLFMYSEREKVEARGAVWVSASVPPDRLVSRPARLNRNRNRSVVPRHAGQEGSTVTASRQLEKYTVYVDGDGRELDQNKPPSPKMLRVLPFTITKRKHANSMEASVKPPSPKPHVDTTISTTSGSNDASPHAEQKVSSTTSTSNNPFMAPGLETDSKPSTTDSKPRSSKHFGADDSADTKTAPFSASLINPFSKYLKSGGDDNGSAYTCTTPPPFFATSTNPFAENFDGEVRVDLASLPRATAGTFNPFPKRSNSGRDDTSSSNTRASRTASSSSNPFSENFKGGDDIRSNTHAARTASNSSNPFSENFKGGDDTTTSNTRAARTASSSSNPFSENFKGGDDTSSSNTRAARSASSPSNPFSKNFKGGDDSSSSALTTSPVTPTGGSLIFPVGPRKSGYDGWSSTPPKPGANDSEKNTKSVPAGEGTFPVPRGKYGDNRVSSSRESTPSWCVEEPVRKSKGEWEVEGEGEELPRESLSSYFSNMPRLAGVVAVVGVVATVGLVALRRR
eukprot:jgi/Undpi1/8841/HiC_scaffold_25.g11303.m1